MISNTKKYELRKSLQWVLVAERQSGLQVVKHAVDISTSNGQLIWKSRNRIPELVCCRFRRISLILL